MPSSLCGQMHSIVRALPLSTATCAQAVDLLSHAANAAEPPQATSLIASFDALGTAVKASGQSFHKICSDLLTHGLLPALTSALTATLGAYTPEAPTTRHHVQLVDAAAAVLLLLLEHVCIKSHTPDAVLHPAEEPAAFANLLDPSTSWFRAAALHYRHAPFFTKDQPGSCAAAAVEAGEAIAGGGGGAASYRELPGAAAYLLAAAVQAAGDGEQDVPEPELPLSPEQTVQQLLQLFSALLLDQSSFLLSCAITACLSWLLEEYEQDQPASLDDLLVTHPAMPRVFAAVVQRLVDWTAQLTSSCQNGYATAVRSRLLVWMCAFCKHAWHEHGLQALQNLLREGLAEGGVQLVSLTLCDPGAVVKDLLPVSKVGAACLMACLLMSPAGCLAAVRSKCLPGLLANTLRLPADALLSVVMLLAVVFGAAPPREEAGGTERQGGAARAAKRTAVGQEGGRGKGVSEVLVAAFREERKESCHMCQYPLCIYHTMKSRAAVWVPGWVEAAQEVAEQIATPDTMYALLTALRREDLHHNAKVVVLKLISSLVQETAAPVSSKQFHVLVTFARQLPQTWEAGPEAVEQERARHLCMNALVAVATVLQASAAPMTAATANLLDALLLQDWMRLIECAAAGSLPSVWVDMQALEVWLFSMEGAVAKGYLPAAHLLPTAPLPLLPLMAASTFKDNGTASYLLRTWLVQLQRASPAAMLQACKQVVDSDTNLDMIMHLMGSHTEGMPADPERNGRFVAMNHSGGIVTLVLQNMPDDVRLIRRLLGNSRFWVATRQLLAQLPGSGMGPLLYTVTTQMSVVHRLVLGVVEVCGGEAGELVRLAEQRVRFLGWEHVARFIQILGGDPGILDVLRERSVKLRAGGGAPAGQEGGAAGHRQRAQPLVQPATTISGRRTRSSGTTANGSSSTTTTTATTSPSTTTNGSTSTGTTTANGSTTTTTTTATTSPSTTTNGSTSTGTTTATTSPSTTTNGSTSTGTSPSTNGSTGANASTSATTSASRALSPYASISNVSTARGASVASSDSAPAGGDMAAGRRECVVCGARPRATFLCSGCKQARYCSEGCQKTHWKEGGHKRACRALQQR